MTDRRKRYPRAESPVEVRRAFAIMGEDLNTVTDGLAAFIEYVAATYVPYAGAIEDVNLGVYDLAATEVNATTVTGGTVNATTLNVTGTANIDTISSTTTLSITNNVDMGGSYTVTNLAAPVNGSDAVTLDFLTAAITEYIYTCDSVTLDAGTYVSGDHTSVHELDDGQSYNVNEVAATPGYSITFNYSGLTSFNRVRLHAWYQPGSSTHTVRIQLYNYDTTTWDNKTTISPSSSAPTYYDISIADSDPYIDGSGNAQLRLYHESPGNPSHLIEVDYAVLAHAGFGTTRDHGGLLGLGDDDHSQYSLADGTRAFTGTVAGITPVADEDLATKGYVDGAGGTVTVDNDEGVALVIGTPVYISSDGAVSRAQATMLAKACVLGLVKDSSIAVAGSGKVLFSGVLEATTGEWDTVTGGTGGLTPKSTYYLSLTLGQLTTVPVSEVGEICTEVGTAISTTQLKVEIRRTIEL